MHRKTHIFVVCILLAASSLLGAQQTPTVFHAQFSTQSAEHGLGAQIDLLKRQRTPLWAGYLIPAADHFHASNAGETAFLEGDHAWSTGYHGLDEAADSVIVLMRITEGNVQKIRIESPTRKLDAGGLRFVWLTDVAPADSVRTLRSLVVTGGLEPVREDAVFVISLHRAPEATPALVELAGAGSSLALREKAAFWLANQRGHDGFLAIQRFARDDQDAQFREKLAFDLTLSHDPTALGELVRMAHQDGSAQVRRQAQFWMAMAGGKKVRADLRGSAENDPAREVRKSAVFALSRLPGEEAVTQLIQVAQTSKDAEVRKQAVFWLGQSSDPHALDYLTRLLTSN